MLERLEQVSAAGQDVVLETTLATLSHARRVEAWQAAGYRVELIYLQLPSAEHFIERVAQRVAEGGMAFRKPTSEDAIPQPRLPGNDLQAAR